MTDAGPVADLSGAGLTMGEPPIIHVEPRPQPVDAPVDVPAGELVQRPASAFVVERGGFAFYSHQGEWQFDVGVDELLTLSLFDLPVAPEDLRGAIPLEDDEPLVTPEAFDGAVARLVSLGLLDSAAARPHRSSPGSSSTDAAKPAAGRTPRAPRPPVEHDPEDARVPVVPVNTSLNVAPLALGLLIAHAAHHDDGALESRYRFVTEFVPDRERFLEWAQRPSIFLFSNYVWDVDEHLALSKVLKEASPDSIMVHGGPSTPKYEGDLERWFEQHPHVDVAVRGEGEATFVEMLVALAGRDPGDLAVLADVAGLSFRHEGRPVRTEDRERIADLSVIESPYLLGYFDEFGELGSGAVIETNRGCPYGCTFCDWGSATLSRIRKFPMERVFAELDWVARHRLEVGALADANFGIFSRDVEISEHIATLRREHGYPRTVAVNYAKNTVKHLRTIIDTLAEAGILTEGLVSLQSMDEPTLEVIRRSNIRLDKYDALTTEFRRSDLPLAADIMMGLPGSTVASFHDDLQGCVDRDVRVRANPTQLLPNSPMNDPEYREEHGIVAEPGELVKETKTYTREDWEEMDRLRLGFYLFDNWGLLRYVARYVRRELGLKEVEVYDRVQRAVHAEPDRWPFAHLVLEETSEYMAPPASWGLFVAEVGEYLRDVLGLQAGSGLDVTLSVQLAHLPAPDRVYPERIELAHDYPRWQEVVFETRDSGHRDDWERHVPRLEEFGPTELVVDDPNAISQLDVGTPMAWLAFNLRNWELESPISRPRIRDLSAV